MSWLYSQALVEEYWPQNCKESKPSAPLSVIPTQQPFWHKDKTTDILSHSRFGPMCAHLTEVRGGELLTSFRAAFPAKTSVSRGGARVSKAKGRASGIKCGELLARYSLPKCELKIAQRSLFEDLSASYQTWPRWGMWADGAVWEQVPSIQYVRAKDSGVSLLRPTAQCWKAWTFLKLSSLIRKNHADGNIQEQSARCFHKMITPESNEILMQWPKGWTALKPLEMDRIHTWLQQHSPTSAHNHKEITC